MKITHENILNESKEDWERFREYLTSNTEGYTDEQIDGYIKYFQLNKERLSPLSRDIYFWLKQDPNDFFTTVDELKAAKTNKQVEDEAKQGAELKAENDNYRVYKINNYGASCKYGANTKWCITSKFRPDYKDYYWQRYSNGNDIYFIISKHPTGTRWDKIAFLKDKFYGDDDVIYDAEDNSYTKFPSTVARKLKGMPKFDGIDLNNYMELYSKEDMDKYKELLDKNLITQDEFNRRKEQSVLGENLSLNESITKVEDTYITYSVNDVLAFLEDRDKSYRIVYDNREQMYLLGDAIETIHHELIFTAYNNGYLNDQKEFIEKLGNIDNYIDYGQGGQFIENDNGEDEEVDQYLFYIVYNPKGNNDLDFEVDGYDKVYKGVKGDLLTRDSKLEDTPLYSAWTRYNKQLERELHEDLKDKAKDYFGTTYFKKLAGYLNTDGTYLDFSGERFGNVGATTRSQDHREIADIIDNAESGTDAMYQYMNEGNIRLMPEAPGIDIIKEPTEKQYAQLKDYIDYFLYKEKVFYIDISDSNGNNIKSFEYLYPTKIDSIVEDIKNYFKEK